MADLDFSSVDGAGWGASMIIDQIRTARSLATSNIEKAEADLIALGFELFTDAERDEYQRAWRWLHEVAGRMPYK